MQLCQTGKENDIQKYHLKWLFQEKKDGVRCWAYCLNGIVTLRGRNGTDYSSKFPEIVESLKGLNGIFDGEICCDTFNHTASRVHTENKLKSKLLIEKYPAVFYIFDFVNNLILLERLKILNLMIKDRKNIMLLPYTYDGVVLFEKMKKEKKEGVIIKNPLSKYENNRSWNWIKVKLEVTKDIKVNSYSVNPAGIRVEGEGLACQITGSNSVLVKKEIDETGSCLIEVKGLEFTENNKIRQIVFKALK